MSKLLLTIRTFFSQFKLSKTESLSDVLAIIIAVATLVLTIISNKSQDEQWNKTFETQQKEIEILEIAVNEIGEQNEVLTDSFNELSHQNDILEKYNKVLQNSLEELEKLNEVSEKSLDQQLLEKGIQCRISYLCCHYESFWVLLKELEQDKLLIVENDLTRVLDFEHIENSAPYDYPESYLKLKEDLGASNSVVIVLLKIDLTSNSTVLTQNLTLNLTEVDFSNILPITLSKLSMYSTDTGLDHFGNPVDLMHYQGEASDVSYSFSDQIISNDRYTTILCPVMVQADSDSDINAKYDQMLLDCTTTYKTVFVPHSVTFTDFYSDEIVTKSIRDINDTAAITEYKKVVGYG